MKQYVTIVNCINHIIKKKCESLEYSEHEQVSRQMLIYIFNLNQTFTVWQHLQQQKVTENMHCPLLIWNKSLEQ